MNDDQPHPQTNPSPSSPPQPNIIQPQAQNETPAQQPIVTQVRPNQQVVQPLPQPTQTQQTTQSPVTPQQQFSPSTKTTQPLPGGDGGSKKKVLAFAIAGIMLLGLLASVFFLLSDDDGSDAPSSETVTVRDRESLDPDATKEVAIQDFFDCTDKELVLPSSPPLNAEGEVVTRVFDTEESVTATIKPCEQFDTPMGISFMLVRGFQDKAGNLYNREFSFESDADKIETIFMFKIGNYRAPEDSTEFPGVTTFDLTTPSGEVLTNSGVESDGDKYAFLDRAFSIAPGEQAVFGESVSAFTDELPSLEGYSYVYEEKGRTSKSKIIIEL